MKKFFAPGRVNLIGEHLDYNGGLVLPVSLQMGITLTLQERTDGIISLQSATHPYTKDFFSDENQGYSIGNDWTNYPIGVLQHLKEEGFHTNGCDLHFESTLPESSGLSSSAAIEIVTAYALLQTQNVKVDLVWACKLLQVGRKINSLGCNVALWINMPLHSESKTMHC
jgi:galactokinase